MTTHLTGLQLLYAGPVAAVFLSLSCGALTTLFVFVARLSIEVWRLTRQDRIERYVSAQDSLRNAIDLGKSS